VATTPKESPMKRADTAATTGSFSGFMPFPQKLQESSDKH
jgi:hypothetical protein